MKTIPSSRTPLFITGLLVSAGMLTGSMTVASSARAVSPKGGAPLEPAPVEPAPVEPIPVEPDPEEPAAAAAAAASCDPSQAVFSMGCEIDLSDPVDPLWPCAVPGITTQSWNGQGLTVRIDMDAAPPQFVPSGEWDMLEVFGMTAGLSGYSLDIGNSPSNNGWTGDSGHTIFDAEAHLYGTSLYVWHGDQAGSGQALGVNNAVSSSGGFFEATVCDGSFTWSSDTTSPTTVTHNDSMFQLRNAPDNDGQYYYVSFNQVVQGPYRSGSGIDPYPYLILSAL